MTASPELSARKLAKQAGVSPTTALKHRKVLEAEGSGVHMDTSTGAELIKWTEKLQPSDAVELFAKWPEILSFKPKDVRKAARWLTDFATAMTARRRTWPGGL